MYVVLAIVVLVFIVLMKTAIVVPQQSAFVVETLGRYSRTIQAGFHILVPFVERIAYKHNLKEEALDIPEQVCITKDNVQVGVDGVLYMQVLDARSASYGITNYKFAIIQLAQTTLRSEIGKIDLDRTFEARATINANVVSELDHASAAWGVKVLRYEIKNINPPKDVLHAMEKQMRAEREKRAVVLTSEGERDAKINQAEGEKAARDQGVRGEQTAADQSGRRPGRSDPRGGHGHGRRPAPCRRSAVRPRRHGGHAAACRGRVRQAVRPPGRRGFEHADRAGEPERHLVDDRNGYQRREAAAGEELDDRAEQPANDPFEVRECAALVDLVAVR
jgi:regulator of protease activity HflC (stomatin/prohibitin superfamily)